MQAAKTITIDLYTFDQLSEEAKEKARNWYREGNLYYEWWDGVYEWAESAGKLLGIDFDTKGKASKQPTIWFSGFWTQGSGCNFDGTYRYKKGSVAAIKAEFPNEVELHRIAKALQDAQKKQFYKLFARCSSGRSACVQNVSVEHEEDSYRDISNVEDDITQALQDFAHWIYRKLEAEYEYLQSDEVIDEQLSDIGYLFDEDGEWMEG